MAIAIPFVVYSFKGWHALAGTADNRHSEAAFYSDGGVTARPVGAVPEPHDPETLTRT